jgi:tripartite ATP-independent transporter DctP family solute receptor
MTINRRSFVKASASAAALTLVCTRRARAADFNLKIGTTMPSSMASVTDLHKIADRISADTAGKVDLKVFPDSQLGSDADMLSQLRSGALPMLSATSGAMGTLVPSAAMCAMGFAFKDYDQVWRAMDGDLGNHVRGQLDKVGIVLLPAIFDSGFRLITTSNVQISKADDLNGLKLRVPTSPISAAMFKALGASPTVTPFGEVYSALQTKLVDGQENPLALIQSAKLYEVQKYCSVTNHAWDGPIMCVNKAVWQKMPKDIQEIVARAFREGTVVQRATNAALAEQQKTDMAAAGMKFNDPDVDSFRKKLLANGFYAEMKQKFGPENWAVMEKVSEVRA